MNAPFIWIFLPAALAILLLLFRNARLNAIIGGFFCLFLAITAFLLPIDAALSLGQFNLKIAPAVNLLGRRLTLENADRALLVFLYGMTSLWFLASASVETKPHFVPTGLVLTALLISALAVEPFLYAALLIELAVLFITLILAASTHRPGKGALRFLIFQTLALPFILFSGWLLTGLEANPGDVASVTRAVTLLGLGFSLLLAVFPFYTWIPMLAEENPPYLIGFILWTLTTISTFFGLGFLDRYTWLRESPDFLTALQLVSVVMIASGGLLAAFQRHLGRLFGYAVIIETGFSLFAIGLGGQYGFTSFLLLLVPRALALALWAYTLSILTANSPKMELEALRSAGRSRPYAAVALALAILSLSGLPMLASFAAHLAIWNAAADLSFSLAIWILIGSFGLTIATLRILFNLFVPSENTPWQTQETWGQKIFLSLGGLAMFLFGLFPQWAIALWTTLPPLFQRLGQ